MTGPAKRTRASSAQEDIDEAPPSPAPSSSATPTRRRTNASSSTSQQTLTTPTRPILTRSSATTPTMNPPLTRSSSMFLPSTRRSTNGDSTFGMTMGLPSPAPSSGSSGRGGTLTRTQSTPSLASPSQLKATTGGSGGPSRGKGDDEDFEARGLKRPGKGKENIPPKKDEEDENGSRKRIRIGRRSSTTASVRARSGSVSSIRSEGVSGRLASVAPSTSSNFSRRTPRLPSPSPSISSVTTPSLESFPSFTSIDSTDDSGSLDIDRTPTKPKTRAQVQQQSSVFLTSPPSSPQLNVTDVDATTERMGLVRVQSDITTSSESTDMDTETDEPSESRRPNPYRQTKAYLQLSIAANQTIVGREEEIATLKSYLIDANAQDVGMYVSGPPGTGKTATVSYLGREMHAQGWQFAEVGCMGLKVADVWKRLGDQFDCGKTERDVVGYLKTAPNTFILLDEIDSLLPPPPATASPAISHLLSKLFSLPSTSSGRVKLVAISNTLDLTLRARLVLPDGATPKVLPFKAYAGSDMINILAARLAAMPTGQGAKVDPKAVELLTKKVEAQNGDLRMCMSVLSKAVTLAESEWAKKGIAAKGTEHAVPLIKISLAHTIKAFNSYTSQLKAAAGSSSTTSTVTGKKIRSVPLQGKMVLLAALIFVTRVGAGLPGCPAPGHGSGTSTPTSTPTKSTDVLNTSNLYATYVHLLSHTASPFPPSPESDYRDLLSNLEVLGLVSVTGSSSMTRTGSGITRGRAQGQRVDFSVRDDEVKEGLGLSEGAKGKGLAEEEVSKVWEREEAKMKRAKERNAKLSTSLSEGIA